MKVSERGDLGWPNREPGSTRYGEIPAEGPVRVTLEHADGWFTARVPPPPKGAGAESLKGIKFEWIPKPVAAPPADVPPLSVRPDQLYVGSMGLSALNPGAVAVREPLKGFSGVEVTSADGSQVHAWADVSANGNLMFPTGSQTSKHYPRVPANDALRLNLNHPDGVMTALIPAAEGSERLLNPYASRSLDGVRFEWKPNPVRVPTVPLVDGWNDQQRGASQGGATLNPPEHPAVEPLRSPDTSGGKDWF